MLAALTLGLALTASAQSVQSTPPDAPESAPNGGLLGNNYTDFSFGYLKQTAMPGVLHAYDLVVNQTVAKEGVFGFDGNLSYEYLTGGALGYHDYRNTLMLGATAFAAESWGKLFLTGDAGWANQQTSDITANSLAYAFTAGVEVPVARRLTLTPFIEYQGEPHLQDHDTATANLPNYLWDYGVKATYAITREWSASLTAQLDQRSSSDLGFKAGFNYRF